MTKEENRSREMVRGSQLEQTKLMTADPAELDLLKMNVIHHHHLRVYKLIKGIIYTLNLFYPKKDTSLLWSSCSFMMILQSRRKKKDSACN